MGETFEGLRERLAGNGVELGEMFDYFGRSFSFFDIAGNKIEVWEDYKYS